MSEIAVETLICDICGVGVRPGSEFCYNCGGSVAEKPEEIHVSEPLIEEPDSNDSSQIVEGPGKTKPARGAKRRAVRASNRQPVEIVWEPRTGFSWPFIVGSLFFVLISLALFIAANYLR
ncbi:MAG TPA: hypothetical protein VK612_07085 [Pyrinomonadaceae bacterium]|nr:hypothetical protein [Pyrinomonadaceae bacterium]